jgi:DNA repair exonuclease SbcCD nuclease subunit
MRVLVSGDKHLGLVSDGMSRLEEQRRVLDHCLATLQRERPDVYVDLGDLFHGPRPAPETYAVAVDYVLRLVDWSVQTGGRAFLLVGNHDKPTRGAVHALTPLRTLLEGLARSPRADEQGVRVVDEPEVLVVGDVNLLFLPHVTDWEARARDKESAAAWLAEVAHVTTWASVPALAFAHLEVPGAKTREDDTVQRDTGLAVPAEVFESARVIRTYAGHVHKYQELDRVTVVGSALHVDFGEAADPKGIVLTEVSV